MPNETGSKKSISKAIAPYNFVSIAEQVIQRYDALEDVPNQGVWNDELCSGEIRITMTAETPVFISDGNKDKLSFFRGADGSYQIPGSSLRGLIRENMQILGLGLLRSDVDIQDTTLYYRAIADASSSLKSGLKKRYHDIVGIKPEKSDSGKTYSVARLVKAGYLHCDGQAYYIRPISGKDVFRISRKAPAVKQWQDKYAFILPVYYKDEGKTISETEIPDGKKGMLLGTGWMSKQNHLYLFPQEDSKADSIHLSKQTIIDYQADWESRKNSLPGTRKSKHDIEFWKLPEDGTSKPVFYIERGAQTFFGMSQFLRIPYDYPLHHGLPVHHQELTEKEEVREYCLDYPNAVLGFVDSTRDNEKNRMKKKKALRSRVSFGDMLAVGSPKPMDAIPMILSEPKSSFFAAYVRDGKDYNQENFRLRGFKQYWFKPAVTKPETGDKDSVVTKLRPLPVGTIFTGTIRYQNLHKDELGLLLWCLRLEEGCCQPIGMGKPYGYGKMKLHIDALREYQQEQLYASLIPSDSFFETTDAAARVAELIEAYQTCEVVAQIGGKDALLKTEGIKDLLAIRRVIADNTEAVRYMNLDEYQNVSEKLGDIRGMISTVSRAEADKKEAAKQAKKAKQEKSVEGKVEYIKPCQRIDVLVKKERITIWKDDIPNGDDFQNPAWKLRKGSSVELSIKPNMKKCGKLIRIL